jgi:hypothetical protein
MSKEIKLNDILAAVDLNGKEVWDELTDEQKKSVVFFTLNRYISSVKAKKEIQEHYLVVGNEIFNKNLFVILSKHPKLVWQLACACGHESKQIHYHEWIGLKKEKNKKEKFLSELFPHMKLNDISTLAKITTDKEIKQYCEDLGWDKKQINGIKF